jgi:phospholipid transport system substrate-binding protein
VKTEVKQTAGGANIPIHYSFYKTDSIWKMYDIAIGGVSLTTTYRATYAEMLQQEGIDALIANIAKSNKEPPQDKDRGSTKSPKKGSDQ